MSRVWEAEALHACQGRVGISGSRPSCRGPTYAQRKSFTFSVSFHCLHVEVGVTLLSLRGADTTSANCFLASRVIFHFSEVEMRGMDHIQVLELLRCGGEDERAGSETTLVVLDVIQTVCYVV